MGTEVNLSAAADTDPLPLDGCDELSRDERKQLRELLREHSHMRWAGKKLRLVIFIAAPVVTGLWQLWDFIKAHYRP